MVFDPEFLQVGGQHVGRKAGLTLVEVDGHDGEPYRCALLQAQQDVEHAEAVLAAREADHHAVTLADHVEIGNGLAGQAVQAFGELVVLVVFATGVAQAGAGGCGRTHARGGRLGMAGGRGR